MNIDFLSKQVITPIESEWSTPEQKSLIEFMYKFNQLCGDLHSYFNQRNTNDFTTMQADIVELQNQTYNIEQYLDYIVKLSNKLLSRDERQTYSYYDKPVKDEFGNVYESVCAPIVANQDDLLKIDCNGNIWVEGKITTSAIEIGNVFKRLAETYRENVPINTINDLNL